MTSHKQDPLLKSLSLEELKPHPQNPRAIIRRHVVDRIVDGINRAGGFRPNHAITVRKVNGYYEIISGHHRIEAAKAAGLTEVPCWVEEMDDETAMFEMLRSNTLMTEYTEEEKERAAATAGDLAEQRMRREIGLQPRTKAERIKDVVRDDNGFVYIIHAIGTDKYKIGMTKRSVESRIEGIATSSPYKCECIYSIRASKPRRLEKYLHEVFKPYREAGEWFTMPGESISKAKALCNDYVSGGDA